ncbi:MAG: photosystem II stability/assembly factor-like uncharacterized protein [Rhodothermales bacterium]|jgi:photosystem II stability/assembly factor-like uncharacterized protein
MRLRLVFVCSLIAASASAQPTDADLLSAFSWRNIGPANMGGRVVDIEAAENDFTKVFLASASGGVWKSVNAGTTWEAIFDDYGSASIGDIALFQPDPDVVWVGTGEANNRNSVSWGDGVYRSTNGGDSFEHVGLSSTHQIARILAHPADRDHALVCAIGHLWGESGERGLFETTDGGQSWSKLAGGLPAASLSGCTDVVRSPQDPQVLYTAFYERLREPWTFTGGGPNGGIFKSEDGGQTWAKLSRGLPAGDTGRIGLAVSRQDPNVLMALVEAERTNDLSRPGSGLYRTEDAGASWLYVNTYNNRPFYYSQVRINPKDNRRLYLLTTSFMVSDDGGTTLRNGSPDAEVHGDFHAMWLDPTNADRFYLGADKGASLTHDGTHFTLFDNLPLAQFYRIGVDMRDPYYVYGGLQDNGSYAVPTFSRDARGILNDSNWKLHWGDGQHVQIDPRDWRRVYTQMENGRSFRYDPMTHQMKGMRPPQIAGPPFRWNWTSPLVMSPHNPDVLFHGANHLFRSIDRGETWTMVSPDLSTNDPAKTVRGQSGGLTPDNSGAETHGTISTISLSPVDPWIIWAGTDDGNIQVTRDGGASWTNTRGALRGVPDGTWVSRVEASHFDPGTAYVSFDGHRSDLFDPWVFTTTDFGETWADLGGSLPAGQVVRVVREDPVNPDLLFAGTEFAVFASLNRGASWHRLMGHMPTVSTMDLVVHPRDGDLVAGTHGRGLFVMDDITPLQQLSTAVRASAAHLFEQRPATIWENVSRGGQRGHFWWAGENPPSIQNTSSIPRAEFKNTALIAYYVGAANSEGVTLEITGPAGVKRHRAELSTEPGIHRYRWDLGFDPEPLTDAQVAEVESAFAGVLARFPVPQVMTARESFRAAADARQQLSSLQILLSGLIASDLGPEFRLQTATPGTYTVTLAAGAMVQTRFLTIRADPLLDD